MGTNYTWPLAGGSGDGVEIYPNLAGFPASAADGTLAVDKENYTIYVFHTANNDWEPLADLNTVDSIQALSGDVSATGPGTAPATVNSVGGSSAALIHSAELAANAATSADTASTIVKRDSSGNIAVGTVTGSLNGNASSATHATSADTAANATHASAADTATSATSAGSFTGSLAGDVTGPQTATVVSSVGGSSAALVHSGEQLANAATSLNTPSTIVKRDASGNLSVGTITGSLSGNATSATTAGSSTNFTGSLSGDVTGTQSATVISKVSSLTSAGVVHTTAAGILSSSPVVDADVSATAGIARSKLAQGNPGFVVIEDASGNLTDEKYLAKVRGGAGQDLTNLSFPPSGALALSSYIPTNYFMALNAEIANTNAFQVYSDTPGTSPVSGTGSGAISIAFTRTTTTQLAGTGSYLITKPASNCQGQGVSVPAYIDPAFKTSQLQFSMNYNFTGAAASGLVGSASDIQIFLHDETNNVFIPLSTQVLTGSGANNFLFKATFQAASNSTAYRVCIHIATTSTAAYTLTFDNLYLGPQITSTGYAGYDPISFPLTVMTGATVVTQPTYTTNLVRQWRVGNRLMMRVDLTWTTAATLTGSGTYLFSLPPGLNADLSNVATSGVVGGFKVNDNSNAGIGNVLLYSANQVQLSGKYSGGGSTSTIVDFMVGTTAFGFIDSPAVLSFWAEIPIAGWSSNCIMSADQGNQQVGTFVSLSANQSIANASNTLLLFNNVETDLTGSYSPTTGGYTCPSSGLFKIGAMATFTSTVTGPALLIYKNGAFYKYISNLQALTAYSVFGSIDNVLCKTGDVLAVYAVQNSGSTQTISGNITQTYATFSKQQGPQGVLVSDSVGCHYWNTSGQSIPTSAITTITGWTRDFDTHTMLTPSTGQVLIPAPGMYMISGWLLYASTTNANSNAQWYILKNGVLLKQNTNFFPAGLSSASVPISFPTRLLAGDILTIQTFQNLTGSAVPLSTGSGVIDISVVRTGP